MKEVKIFMVMFLTGMCVWGMSFHSHVLSAAGDLQLEYGTVVVVKVIEEIDPENVSPGDVLEFEVARNVLVDGVIVIQRGTPAFGEVIQAKGEGFVGKAGDLDIILTSTRTVDGQKVPLRGHLGKEGEGHTGASVALGVAVCPLALLMKGEAVTIPAESEIKAYVDNTMTIVGPEAAEEESQEASPAKEEPSEEISWDAALQHDNLDQIKALLEQGADVNPMIEGNVTALHYTSAHNQKEIATLLLDSGADVNATIEQGVTPLHAAALNGHIEVAALLLDHGAEVNTRNTLNGLTPLHLAVVNNHREMVELLLVRGADHTVKAHDGSTPLMIAESKHYDGLIDILTPQTEEPSKEYVRQAQSLLKQLGYAPGPADGIMGDNTETAIRNFQQDSGYTVDGKITNILLLRLHAKLPPESSGKTPPVKDEKEAPVSSEDRKTLAVSDAKTPPSGTASSARDWVGKTAQGFAIRLRISEGSGPAIVTQAKFSIKMFGSGWSATTVLEQPLSLSAEIHDGKFHCTSSLGYNSPVTITGEFVNDSQIQGELQATMTHPQGGGTAVGRTRYTVNKKD